MAQVLDQEAEERDYNMHSNNVNSKCTHDIYSIRKSNILRVFALEALVILENKR